MRPCKRLCEKTRLFMPENLSMADLTFLHENYEQVMNRLHWMTQQYLEARQGAELVDQP